jgi:hypothetical protein
MEPWIAAVEQAFRQHTKPRIFLLVSWDQAKALSRGTLPPKVQEQAAHMISYEPPKAKKKARR